MMNLLRRAAAQNGTGRGAHDHERRGRQMSDTEMLTPLPSL
jgi:hypothetical protein